jgi:16S rRNA (cytosine967-C5)-methyltransferase
MTILLEHAAELARLLLKSSQPPRELASTYLHKQKRLDSSEKQFISAAAHHALRVWRFARACAIGETSDVDVRPSVRESRAVLAASLLLSSHGFLPPFIPRTDITEINSFGADDGSSEFLPVSGNSDSMDFQTVADAASPLMLAREAEMPLETLLARAVQLDDAAQRAAKKMTASHETRDDPSNGNAEDNLAVAVRWSLPDWVLRSWREQETPLSYSMIIELGRGLCRAAPLTLRVNTLRGDRETLIASLQVAGIEAAVHPILPEAVQVPERQSLMESPWYEAGMFEVQDAGSQLITLACGVRPEWEVLDACAGGGGKTMHLADVMQDNGRLVACDIERSKLRGLEQRGRRLTLRSIQTIALTPEGKRQDGGAAFTDHEQFDCVLVDAPCSGFGTVRRHPALKWRLSEKTVMRLAGRQEAILSRNAQHVRAGGILLYATCSLLPQENSENLRRFLDRHPDFTLDPIAPQFAAAGVALPSISSQTGEVLLPPALLDSDGFYMARLRRGQPH